VSPKGSWNIEPTSLLTITTAAGNTPSYSNLLIVEDQAPTLLTTCQLMGSKIVLKCFRLCRRLALSHADVTTLPFDRGPQQLLTTACGCLKTLPFDRGPCRLLLDSVPSQHKSSAALQRPDLVIWTPFSLCLLNDGFIFCLDILASVYWIFARIGFLFV